MLRVARASISHLCPLIGTAKEGGRALWASKPLQRSGQPARAAFASFVNRSASAPPGALDPRASAAPLRSSPQIMPGKAPARDDDPTGPVPPLDSFPASGTPTYDKLHGWDLYRALGKPKHVVAPMVDQSELAWRILSRRHGAQLVYTPMISARAFTRAVDSRGPLEHEEFWIAVKKEFQEEGMDKGTGPSSSADTDRPLIVQFAGNDPAILLQAARVVEPYCDAVDLNLGCPQHIARRGHYGAFLQSDWQLIFQLINTLHLHLRVPVTAKMRVFDSTERTVAYARMLERAGAQIIAVHGRTREMKGHKTGLADWHKIRAVKEAVSVPVFGNGNILFHEDVKRGLYETSADGIMSAEGNLYNPAIFEDPPSHPTPLYPLAPTFPFPRIANLAHEYLDVCESLTTPTASSAIRAHFFRLARPALEVHRDLRPVLGKVSIDNKARSNADRYRSFRNFVNTLQSHLEADECDEGFKEKYVEAQRQQSSSPQGHAYEPDKVPHWLAQPYYRKEMPPQDEVAEDTAARLEKRKARLQDTAAVRRADEKNERSAASATVPINDKQARDEENVLALGSPGPSMSMRGDSSSAGTAKTAQEILQEGAELKSEANVLFGKGQYEEAILAYTSALDCLPARQEADISGSEEEEETTDVMDTIGVASRKGKTRQIDEDETAVAVRHLRAVVYANLAASHGKLQQHKEAVVACNHALEDDPTYLKALHRRAQANEQLGTWSALSSALEDYKTMQTLPHALSLNTSIHDALRRLPPRIDETSAREKEEMMGKLKGIGDSVLGFFGLSTDNFQLQKQPGEGGGYSLNFNRQ